MTLDPIKGCRFAVVSAIVLFGASWGCGPTFDSPKQELTYLCSLSNPSPAQFKRRQELVKDVLSSEVERAGQFEKAHEPWKAVEVYEQLLEILRGHPDLAEAQHHVEALKRVSELRTVEKSR
jgi:hypothetical protein